MKVINSVWVWDLFSKLLFVFLLSISSQAELLIAPDAALRLRFGDTAVITKKNIALSNDQLQQVRKRARMPLEEKIFTLYKIDSADGKPLGFAALISDLVRTHNQTVMFFIDHDGLLKGAELIAYYEPPEYKITSKWMNQRLMDKSLKDPLASGDDLPVVTGSTLTVDSLARSARLALALWEITFAKTPKSE